MKITTIATIGLISLMTLGLADTVQADSISETKGIVGFDVDWSIQPPTEEESIENPNPGSTSGNDDLSVIYAMDFDFGTHNYDGTALTGLEAAVGQYTPEGTSGTTIKDVLGISIGNSGNTGSWFLYANPTEFVGNGTTITGLTMALNGVSSRNVIGSQLATVASSNITLTPNAENAIASYTNNATEAEMSINNIAFGTWNGTGSTYSGVTLDVPAGKNIQNGVTYTSDITWTLATDAI